MAPHRLRDIHRRLGLLAMRDGGWGRVQKALGRAFVANPDRPLTTTELCRWAHPRGFKVWNRFHVVKVANRLATRIGRRNPGGILWALKSERRAQSLGRSESRESDQ